MSRAVLEAGEEQGPIAIVAGGGRLPQFVAREALQRGRAPVILAIAGETLPPEAFAPNPVHVVRWGEIGRLFRLAQEHGCREAVLVGSIARRPDYRTIRPDLTAVKLIPRILRLMSGRDGSLLAGVARIIEEHGLRIVSPLSVAPGLALGEGCVVGPVPPHAEDDIGAAREAARAIGSQDIAQGAVAVGGRVVAVEDAEGTDALLERVALLRRSGALRQGGGVLVKCLKPMQDGRHDLPTIGPTTAEEAQRAGLEGVAAEAGGAILVGREETLAAFRAAGLFLAGFKGPKLGHE